MQCPACLSEVSLNRLDLQRKRARCQKCGHVFDCASQVPASVFADDQHMEPSEKVRIQQQGSTLKILYTWTSAKYFATLIFGAAWNLVIIYVFYEMSSQAPVFVMVLPVAFLLVGVGVLYYSLCGFFNRSEVTVTPHVFTVWHGPLPLFGSRSFRPTDITEVSIKVLYGKNNEETGYALEVQVPEGRMTVLKEIDDLDDAQLIKRKLQAVLHLSQAAKPEIKPPLKFLVQHTDHELIIQFPLFKPHYPMLIVVGLMCLAFPFALLGGRDMGNLIATLCMLLVGFGLAYWGLVGCVNRMVLQVNRQSLLIRSEPLRNLIGSEIPAQDIDQLFVRFVKSRRHQWYELCAEVKNRGKVTLLSQLETQEQAQYLEQEVESFLKIQDDPSFDQGDRL